MSPIAAGAHSGNGWPVLDLRPAFVLIPGTYIRIAVRLGDVATVLTHLAARFNAEVESLALYKTGDEWGWARRLVRGSTTTISNHSSATAVDFNATRHPRGVKGTYTAAQVAAVRSILLEFVDPVTKKCVIRWGNDYVHSPVDSMHFEINADSAAVARVAKKLRWG